MRQFQAPAHRQVQYDHTPKKKRLPAGGSGLSPLDFSAGRLTDLSDSSSHNAAVCVAKLRIQSWLCAKTGSGSSESPRMRQPCANGSQRRYADIMKSATESPFGGQSAGGKTANCANIAGGNAVIDALPAE